MHAFPLFQKEMLVKHVSCRMVSFPKNHSRPMHSETMSQGVGTWILTIQKIQVSIHSLRKVLELLVVLQVQVLFLPGHDSIGLYILVLCIQDDLIAIIKDCRAPPPMGIGSFSKLPNLLPCGLYGTQLAIEPAGLHLMHDLVLPPLGAHPREYKHFGLFQQPF